MKYLHCVKCNKRQASGKFCLDCGSELKEVIDTSVKFTKINSSRTADQLKRDIRTWLTRLGVQNSDIQIRASGNESEIEYLLNRTKYKFKSHLQDNLTNNIAAIEQFLHYRVLGIERGIETGEQAFSGYEALPDLTQGDEDPYLVLGFKEKVDIDVARNKYKELIKRFHPDINDSPEASNQFRRLKIAMDKIEAL